jgi:uncharacterized protein (UPF0335 family)
MGKPFWLWWSGALSIESIKELKRTLKGVGYSDKAVNEILKWYKSVKTTDERT